MSTTGTITHEMSVPITTTSVILAAPPTADDNPPPQNQGRARSSSKAFLPTQSPSHPSAYHHHSASASARTGTEPNASSDGAPKSQKQMSKAERRELQERQRAAKAAAKAAAPGATPGPAKPNAAGASGAGKGTPQPTAVAPKKPGKAGDVKPGKAVDGKPVKGEQKDAPYTHAHSQIEENSRCLRIFSHFGLPKSPSVPKGDVHPAIIRLGLQFSDFKITGANARCIAMLNAFKTVSDRATDIVTQRSSEMCSYVHR